MFILESVSSMSGFCSSIILYRVLVVIRKSLNLIQIIGPILAIISLTISFVMLTINPNDAKDSISPYKKRIKNSIIATIILFLMPALINFIMQLPVIEQNTTLGECWASVDANKNKIK